MKRVVDLGVLPNYHGEPLLPKSLPTLTSLVRRLCSSDPHSTDQGKHHNLQAAPVKKQQQQSLLPSSVSPLLFFAVLHVPEAKGA